jgi:hypothetical protein
MSCYNCDQISCDFKKCNCDCHRDDLNKNQQYDNKNKGLASIIVREIKTQENKDNKAPQNISNISKTPEPKSSDNTLTNSPTSPGKVKFFLKSKKPVFKNILKKYRESTDISPVTESPPKQEFKNEPLREIPESPLQGIAGLSGLIQKANKERGDSPNRGKKTVKNMLMPKNEELDPHFTQGHKGKNDEKKEKPQARRFSKYSVMVIGDKMSEEEKKLLGLVSHKYENVNIAEDGVTPINYAEILFKSCFNINKIFRKRSSSKKRKNNKIQKQVIKKEVIG